jgi:glycosyltransferase involved in cell wall biosynthesis
VKLPISVIIPTLNCRKKLVRHLDAIEEWLPLVEEIIAIDSNSSDGTKELLEERLQPYGANILSTGRGLYQAWNLGASLATQPYVYYSTVCDIISKNGLVEMSRLIESHRLDVLISPPKMVDEDGEREVNVKWPIHYVLKYLEFKEGVTLVTNVQKMLFLAPFIPATILGSSASNLYRTQILKEHPFPLDVGTVGDSYWALKNFPYLSIGIANEFYATFCWDGVRNGPWDESGEIMEKFKKEEEALNNITNSIGFIKDYYNIGYINEYFKDECRRLQAAIKEYDAYVKFLTRPLSVKAKDVFFKYTSVRYWWGRIFSRG